MTVPSLKPSPVLLLVLAMLEERPMHPYEMQRLAVERGKQAVVAVKRGSLYHAVDRLLAAGMIEEQGTDRAGRRPERTVYRITETGREELRDWQRDLLANVTDEFPSFATALSFLAVLDPPEVLAALRRRVVFLDGAVARREATLRSIGGRLPRVFLIEEEYMAAAQRAERDWTATVIGDLETGRFTWDRADFGPQLDAFEERP